MELIKYPSKKEWVALIARPSNDLRFMRNKVKHILRDVKRNGDTAVKKYEEKYSNAIPEYTTISNELKLAIQSAKKNIEIFHRTQVEAIRVVETLPGVRCWRKAIPIERVGLYIPGGTAPLFSTVLMLAVPAIIAGCREIILCTASRHPAVLYTAEICGIKKIFHVGGAQAVAAMAYGTKTIPKVQKIFGPGNQYVTQAKQIVQLDGVAIDMPAGPSELLVIADESADAKFVAADLLSQAEHGPDSQVLLLSISETFLQIVKHEIALQMDRMDRKEIALLSLMHCRFILFHSLEECIEFSNAYAPEHLILACADISDSVINAGSVFIGNYSPEAAGDYASGTNHSLPTNGYAAMYSGVSVDSFCKKMTFQQLSEEGLRNISSTVMTMAEAEGLQAHKNAIKVRL